MWEENLIPTIESIKRRSLIIECCKSDSFESIHINKNESIWNLFELNWSNNWLDVVLIHIILTEHLSAYGISEVNLAITVESERNWHMVAALEIYLIICDWNFKPWDLELVSSIDNIIGDNLISNSNNQSSNKLVTIVELISISNLLISVDSGKNIDILLIIIDHTLPESRWATLKQTENSISIGSIGQSLNIASLEIDIITVEIDNQVGQRYTQYL